MAQVTVDMLLLLCDHLHILLASREALCRRVIDVSYNATCPLFAKYSESICKIMFNHDIVLQSMCTAVHLLLASTEKSNALEDKRVRVKLKTKLSCG